MFDCITKKKTIPHNAKSTIVSISSFPPQYFAFILEFQETLNQWGEFRVRACYSCSPAAREVLALLICQVVFIIVLSLSWPCFCFTGDKGPTI